MTPTHRIPIALTVLVALAPVVRAQLIGPIPPPTPPTPDYVPGAQTPPSGDMPPNPEPPAPSIVERTPAGDLKLIANPEQAALDKYPFDTTRRDQIAKSTKARALDVDRFVISNLEKVLAARAMRPKVESSSEYAPLFEARDLVAALAHERLIDRLLRDRAITMAQRARLDETLRGYEKAVSEQISKDAAAEPNRTAILHLRRSFVEATREVFEALDRQVDHLADNFESISPQIALAESRQPQCDAALASYKAVKNTLNQTLVTARRALIRTLFFDEFDAESRRAALTAGLAARLKTMEVR